MVEAFKAILRLLFLPLGFFGFYLAAFLYVNVADLLFQLCPPGSLMSKVSDGKQTCIAWWYRPTTYFTATASYVLGASWCVFLPALLEPEYKHRAAFYMCCFLISVRHSFRLFITGCKPCFLPPLTVVGTSLVWLLLIKRWYGATGNWETYFDI
jgi:hypothetical protein